MRDLHELDRYRLTDMSVMTHFGSIGDSECGAFSVPSPFDHQPMNVIASSGMGFDHVSVSRKNRTPNWREMEYVKRLFARDDETWVQYHVPASDHVNVHPYCLHIWRPIHAHLPRPPGLLVG